MRAREPDRSGFVERDGVKVGWELFDRDLPADAPSVFLLPTWAIVHSRFWKGQVPDLARRYRVLTMECIPSIFLSKNTYTQVAEVGGISPLSRKTFSSFFAQ